MPNPRGINQYTKGRGGGKSKPKSAKQVAAKIRSNKAFSLGAGTSSAAHDAFVASRMAAAAKRKKRR